MENELVEWKVQTVDGEEENVSDTNGKNLAPSNPTQENKNLRRTSFKNILLRTVFPLVAGIIVVGIFVAFGSERLVMDCTNESYDPENYHGVNLTLEQIEGVSIYDCGFSEDDWKALIYPDLNYTVVIDGNNPTEFRSDVDEGHEAPYSSNVDSLFHSINVESDGRGVKKSKMYVLGINTYGETYDSNTDEVLDRTGLIGNVIELLSRLISAIRASE